MNVRPEDRGERGWSEADRAKCVAYIDGLLDQREQLEFERRLAEDPALAERVRALLETDELLRGAKAQTAALGARANARRPLVWAASLAAAAALLVWLGVQLVRRPTTPSFQVALAPSFEAGREYAASVAQLEGLVARGVETLRGDTAVENVTPERFVEVAREAELEEANRRLSDARLAQVRAGYFVLPLRLERASDVLVFAARPGEPFELLHPSDGSRQAARLPAGMHVLPGERFVLAGEGDAVRVRYQRGFLTPLGAPELRVLVAARAAETGDAPSIAPTQLEPAALRRALEDAGFAWRELSVGEPR